MPLRGQAWPDRHRRPRWKSHPSRQPQDSLKISLMMLSLASGCDNLTERTIRLPQPLVWCGRRRGGGGLSGTQVARVTSAGAPASVAGAPLGGSGVMRSWSGPPVGDWARSPAQAIDLAEYQGRGRHLGATAPAQAAQRDLQVGQVTALEPEFVVDVADDVNGGPDGGNGPQVSLEHLARQVGRQPDPGDRLHRTARRSRLRRDRPDGATPGYPRRHRNACTKTTTTRTATVIRSTAASPGSAEISSRHRPVRRPASRAVTRASA